MKQHKFKQLTNNGEEEWYRCVKCQRLTRSPYEAYKEECPIEH